MSSADRTAATRQCPHPTISCHRASTQRSMPRFQRFPRTVWRRPPRRRCQSPVLMPQARRRSPPICRSQLPPLAPRSLQTGEGGTVQTGLLASANSVAVSTGTSTTGSYMRDLMRALATIGSMSSSQANDPGFGALVQDTTTSLNGVVSAMATDVGVLGNTQSNLTSIQTQLSDTSTALSGQLSERSGRQHGGHAIQPDRHTDATTGVLSPDHRRDKPFIGEFSSGDCIIRCFVHLSLTFFLHHSSRARKRRVDNRTQR